MRFALLEAKVAIARAVRVVEVQSCEKTEVSETARVSILDFSFPR